MTSFPDEVYDRPMLLALLQMRGLQICEFTAPQSATEQHGENGTIAFPFKSVRWRRLQKPTRLLGSEPISEPYSQLLDTFDAPNSRCEFWTEQASVRGLIGQTSNCCQPSVDRTSGEIAILQKDPESRDDYFAKGQARFGAVPLDEFIDRVSITAL